MRPGFKKEIFMLYFIIKLFFYLIWLERLQTMYICVVLGVDCTLECVIVILYVSLTNEDNRK